jgi:hypothetical protein
MQPSDALGLAAQIAVALAGFAGVVVDFRSGLVHEWKARAPTDRFVGEAHRCRFGLAAGAAGLQFYV